MDFAFNKENEVFRTEVRGFLNEHVSDAIREEMEQSAAGQAIGSLTKELIGKIGDRGWIGMSWPARGFH